VSGGEIREGFRAVSMRAGWGFRKKSPRRAWSLDRGLRGVYSV